jgi:hypothetical protein
MNLSGRRNVKKFEVGYVARSRNSIGSPYLVARVVEADNSKDARYAAFDLLQKEGYETFHINGIPKELKQC